MPCAVSIPSPQPEWAPDTARPPAASRYAAARRARRRRGFQNMETKNKMLIDATHAEETRVVVLRHGRVEEFDYESAARKLLRGNIYLAKVTRVEPSLQAAFVDFGGNRHGFLAFNEIHPDYYQIPVADRQRLIAQDQAADRLTAPDEPTGDELAADEPLTAEPPAEEHAHDDAEAPHISTAPFEGSLADIVEEENEEAEATAEGMPEADGLSAEESESAAEENGSAPATEIAETPAG